MAQVELLPEVTKFVEAPKLMIGGRRVDAVTGETFETIDPSTGEVLAEVPKGGVQDIDAAVAAAREAFEDRRWTGLRPGKKTQILYRLGELIKKNLNELAQIESLDAGKPIS
ncbi:MAG: aldehyde dehydrogenase family protein, partial [Actinomycetota bacterium]|nr:aldehyde dehydrogenase family protein [Actinomycetota bacterium]